MSPRDVTARFEPDAVFGRRRTLSLRGAKTWSEPRHPHGGYGELSTTTTLTWVLRLKRVR